MNCYVQSPSPVGTLDDSSKISPINEMLALRTMIQDISNKSVKIYNLNELCNTYGIKRRGFYDFLSIGTVFKICYRHTNDTFEWYGFNETYKVLVYISQTVQKESMNKGIKEFFDCSANSSLQNLALNVVKLFFYLNTKFLDLRQVAKLFSQGTSKYKTMLRKLYTVAAGLELAEIIGKTNRVAEIKFLHPIPSRAFADPTDIMSMLNTKEELDAESNFEGRRKIFQAITYDRRFLAAESVKPVLMFQTPAEVY